MKRLYFTIIVLLFISACSEDFLDRFPLNEVSDATFWETADDILLYANQFYPQIGHPTLTTPDNYYRDDDRSDNQAPSVRDPHLWNESPIPTTGGGWAKSDWLPIRRVNYALARIENMEKSQKVLSAEAEIRFLKSLFYFRKVVDFGNVPWLEKDLNIDSEELFEGRDDRKLVINNLLDDLDFAITHLPQQSSDLRLTKFTALALKTHICLFEGTFRKYHNLGDWQDLLKESVSAAESIINSGLFDIFSTGNILDDYYRLFKQEDYAGNPEVIFYQHFIKDVRMHNTMRRMYGATRSGFTKDFVNSYLCKDGLPIALSPLYQGDIKWGDEFKNRDPRMRQSIYDNETRPYIIQHDGSPFYKEMPQFESYSGLTSYEMLKYFPETQEDIFQNQQTIDIITYRYGVVLLEYAEAKAELGECTQDILDISINKLRDRVGMPHLTVDVGFIDPDWPEWEVPVSPLINEIRRERRLELATECYRWRDLVRWKAGKIVENPLTYLGARDPRSEDNSYYKTYGTRVRKWDNKRYFLPLPLQDLVLNPNLEQNPGY